MKKEKIVDRSRTDIQSAFGAWNLGFLWSLPVFTAFRRGRAEAESEGGELGDLELFPRSRKSLILLIIANTCCKLLGKKKGFYAAIENQTRHRGAASKELQTRADSRRKHLIPRLSAFIRALF